MAEKAVSRITNEDNLRFFSDLLVGIEHFVFFGTLLGLVRDNKIIEWDDDVDIYVNSNERDSLINVLRKAGINLALDEFPNTTPYILQVQRVVDGEVGLVDFYFYDADKDPDNIWENWNFAGRYKKPNTALKIPKDDIFPITRKSFEGIEVSIPSKAAELCVFLYGKNWNKPLAKGSEYKTKIVNNVPRVFVGKIGKAQRLFVQFLGVLKLLKVG
jgi:hypothetical protein